MRPFLKKYFIPHEENDNKPHILRWGTIKLILLGILVLEVLFLFQIGVVTKRSYFFAEIVSSVLTTETNQNRTDRSLRPLTINPLLQEAAQMKADDMAAKGYFAHVSPDGTTPWDWMQKADYKYSYAGENLAVNFVDSSDVMNAWMESPSHRSNILDAHFTELGVGIAQGKYNGKDAIFVVQMFGAPPGTTVAAAKPVPPKPVTQNVSEPRGGEMLQTIPAAVLGEATTNVGKDIIPAQANLAEKVITSPRAFTNYILVAIVALFLVALALKIGINIKVQHPALIFNGILVLFVINSLLLVNKYLVLSQLKIV